MDKQKILLLISFSLFFAVVLITGRQQEAVQPGKDGPGHPGWMEQWEEMKTLGQGKVPMKKVQQIRAQQRQRYSRAGGNLTEIQEIGPFNVGGRTRALVIDHSNPDHIVAGGVSGGIWQSFDRGESWDPVDDFGANLSVTYLTQSPFDPDIFYYATGEPSGNSAGIPGDGIYKSTDGGTSFSQLPATANSNFDYNWRVEHSLVDTHTIYVATDRSGLYRSVNGGDSFTQVYKYGTQSVTDIEVFPDSSVLIGVDAAGVYYSPTGDSGTFVRRDSGLPERFFRRIELAYPDSMPNVIYAAFVNYENDGVRGIYRSIDHGISWDSAGSPEHKNINLSFPWYCLAMEVRPDNPDYLIIGAVEQAYSANGGRTWIPTAHSHADHHIIRFDPEDSKTFYDGNDGGIYRYHTSNARFDREDLNNGYNVTQFYTGAHFPEGTDFYGGTQDNGTQSTKNGEPDFQHIYGGDGAFTQVNQQVPSVAFVSWQRGNIYRTYNAQFSNPDFHSIVNELDADDDGDIDEGSWFINPLEINRQEGAQLFFPTRDRLWASELSGDFWEPIGNSTNLGGSPYAVGVSNEKDPTVYFGGGNAIFYRVDSFNLLPDPKPKNLSHSVPDSVNGDFIGNITVSPRWDSVLYVAFTNYTDNPRIYKVTDARSDDPNWISVHNDLPKGLPVNWIEVSPLTDSVLIAATDFGLYSSVNAGGNWHHETAIPNTSIHQIRLRHSDGKLFIFTHGRGAFTAHIPGNFFTGLVDAGKEMASIDLYPNPANDKLQIKWPDDQRALEMTIYDLNGRVLRQHKLHRNQSVSISNLKAGVYIVRLHGNGQSYAGRLVKQ